jgi:hypothetical protein
MTAAEFKKHLKSISPKGTVYSATLKTGLAPVDAMGDDLQDLLGDASDGEFEFLTFDDEEEGVGFKSDYVPLAEMGGLGDDGKIIQTEGLLLAKVKAGKVVAYLTVDVDGTLVPGTMKSHGADLAKLKLAKPSAS